MGLRSSIATTTSVGAAFASALLAIGACGTSSKGGERTPDAATPPLPEAGPTDARPSDAGRDSASATPDASKTDAGAPDSTAGGDASVPRDAGTVIQNVYITWYGFNDNSCQVESQHDCNTIAYPVDAGFPTKHDVATEGSGAYDDPITFATACDDDGMTDCEFLPGTIIYVPEVRKYFVMEDQCAECGTDWNTAPVHTYFHTDLWMGPSYSSSDASALNACEDQLTLGNTDMGAGTIVVDPASTLPVDTAPLFTSQGVCTTMTFPPNTVP